MGGYYSESNAIHFGLQSELEAIQTNAMGRVGWGGVGWVGYYSESNATHFGLQSELEVGQLDQVWQKLTFLFCTHSNKI